MAPAYMRSGVKCDWVDINRSATSFLYHLF